MCFGSFLGVVWPWNGLYWILIAHFYFRKNNTKTKFIPLKFGVCLIFFLWSGPDLTKETKCNKSQISNLAWTLFLNAKWWSQKLFSNTAEWFLLWNCYTKPSNAIWLCLRGNEWEQMKHNWSIWSAFKWGGENWLFYGPPWNGS